MLDPHSMMLALSRQRAVFHSEADFQHAFAWHLHEQFPSAAIRLERPFRSKLGLLHVDLVAETDGQLNVIELKYKTRAISVRQGSEEFDLQDHGAQPLGRYDFLKDVARLESIIVSQSGAQAWAIMLSNDSAYWSQPRGHDDTSAEFSLADGRRVTGSLAWSARASAGTRRNREEPIVLANQYVLSWQDYSDVGGRSYSRFRYLALEVPAKAA